MPAAEKLRALATRVIERVAGLVVFVVGSTTGVKVMVAA